jgi:integrase
MQGSVIEYRGKRGVVWRIKYADASGKQVMETVGAERDGVTRKQAEAELRERIVRVEQSQYRKPSALPFADAAERWYASERVSRAWKHSTARHYRHWADDLCEYFHLPIATIKQRHCIEYRDWALSESSYSSPASVNSRLTILRMILGWAKDSEYRPDVPGIKYARVRQHKGSALKPADVQLLSRSFDDAVARVAFLCFVTTGLRRSELQSLRWKDVDLIENRLRVEDSKTEKGERSVGLGKTLAEELWQHRRGSTFQGEDEYVFCHPQLGSHYDSRDFREALMRAFATAGLEWPKGFRCCHDLRVTAATNDAMAGMHPSKMLQKYGWADPGVAQRYINLAGVVFADDAEALEERLLGLSTVVSTDRGESEGTSGPETAWNSPD